ncbi:chemotaxis protein CheA [Pseudomonas fluorescens]|uniref:chemotaxis protein CheA n=1 Tax=Pseudomonas fluorescens TaxID=294 RepID=UPI00177E9A34|nr:chemotaxis protein CheA [Pseudomonas fluorescens]MBD8099491.1 chemotaxis protein CheA [Pseudomonas fluorescens]MBD8776481.1 chemotaxis protein CheA [Pseudomonas fluorescens]MBD8781232.1 chemotaxis protein CheA [Pseudomonas fluorescens]MBD8798077.1 chemotaxis protein CheA [Pseudomonas fluorescens]
MAQPMNMDDVLQTFIAESRELLLQMEDALLQIEQSPHDLDTINGLFRVAHTIKGSAGLFGLMPIVEFTHVAESVLDRVRSLEVRVDEALSALFLDARDHIGQLIDLLAEDGHLERLGEPLRIQGERLAERLSMYLEAPLATPATVPQGAPSAAAGGVGTGHWHLSLRFGPDVLRNGMDPLAFLRYLGTLGQLAHIVTVFDALPSLLSMDPETNYLGFEVALVSDASREVIDGAFDFVRDDALVLILAPQADVQAYRAHIDALPEDNAVLLELLVRCASLTEAQVARVIQEGAPTPADALEVVQDSQASAPKAGKVAANNEGNLIRVDAAKLDQLINLVGELIIAGAGANLVAVRSGIGEMIEATSLLSRLVEEVRDSALTLRMVQIGATFTRFQRVVRDVSKELGKDIVLRIGGGETELDKTVVERIGDPLTHLVRNAMDHGIEAVSTRLQRGKPAQGTVRLNAYHESGSIVIEVSDDGGGLAKHKILAKARERGLVAEGQVPADKDILNLIFEPGFSTADQVSNLSGRGVGMDVVKRNITALRGSVSLESEEGQGTTVRIRLPLTLAIIDGFLIGVGKASYVIPLNMVEECIELAPGQGAESGFLDLRGDVLPILRLRDMFAVQEPGGNRENVVVVHYAGLRAGLVVDRLQGEFQTVIKPLGKVFGEAHGLGGFTILGSGAVALILDIPNLLGLVAKEATHRSIPRPLSTQ